MVRKCLTNRCSRQCTRCLPCGFAVAQIYHKANAAYIAAERGVRLNMKTIHLILIDPDNNVEHPVQGEFTEEQIEVLSAYSSYMDKVNSSALIVRGISGITDFQAFGPEGLDFNGPEYTDSELHELLHVLRPVILQEEFASFHKVQSILKKSFSNRIVSNQMKLAMRRFEHGELSEYMQIKVGGHELFSKSLIKIWLNAEQYLSLIHI